MIVLAVMAILAAIAYPGYQSSVRKSRRADAVDAAARIQQAQERWRANNTTYAAAVGTLGLGATSLGGFYTMSLSGTSGTGYTVTATAIAGTSQAADTGCTTLTLQWSGGNPVYSPTGCWSR